MSRSRIAVLAGVLTLLAACGNESVTSVTAVPPTTTAPESTAPDTTSAPDTTVVDTTVPETTAIPETTVPETTAVPDTTVPPTTEPPAATTTITTEPLHSQELLLTDGGIGSAAFGDDPDAVIAYVRSVLGGDTADSGWIDPYSFADCSAGGAATHARKVDWGVLSLLFADASPYAHDRDHFIGYEYGRVDEVGGDPTDLHTAGDVGLGSSVADLLAEFPGADIHEGDDELEEPPVFYVNEEFWGYVTGDEASDVVTVIFGGHGCAG